MNSDSFGGGGDKIKGVRVALLVEDSQERTYAYPPSTAIAPKQEVDPEVQTTSPGIGTEAVSSSGSDHICNSLSLTTVNKSPQKKGNELGSSEI
mmetsp:Transcript_14988/g.17265  ORF Transcript_14988/g.17265 Transcript_14988/m.17265 type:complete len:94 (+) Transcript_14988:258-539(+)